VPDILFSYMKTAPPVISVQKSSKIARVLFVALLLLAPPCIKAQTLTIRLINAKSGKPVQGKHVSIEWGGQMLRSDQYPLSDELGEIRVDVPPGTKSLSLIAGPKVGKGPNRVPYEVCSRYGEISIEAVLKIGVTTDNQRDSKVSPVPRAGEIIYLIKPLPWWTPDMQ
jgi:hypothetical protein